MDKFEDNRREMFVDGDPAERDDGKRQNTYSDAHESCTALMIERMIKRNRLTGRRRG